MGSCPFEKIGRSLGCLEVLSTAKWKYAMYVNPNTVPVGFNESYETMISTHMRHKRFKNDQVKARVLFCPQDCEVAEPGKKRDIMDGTCYGPLLSGCIFGLQKKENP